MLNITLDASQLKRLKEKVSAENYRQAVDVSLFNIGEEIVEKAHTAVRYKKGDLRRSIIAKHGKNKVEVGTDKVYAMIHEFGGTITPKNKKMLAWSKDGGKTYFFAKQVTITPQPYLMPQFYAMQDGRALDIITKEIDKTIK